MNMSMRLLFTLDNHYKNKKTKRMVVIGVLTNCNPGDLLAISSLIQMTQLPDRIHIRLYGQNGNVKYGVIKELYGIIKAKEAKQDKTTVPIEISRYRTAYYEKRYTNDCLSYRVFKEASHTNFVPVPNEGFDKLYAFSELEELFNVKDNVLSKLRGNQLFINGDYNVLRHSYLISKNITFSHLLIQTNIQYLLTKFKQIYYFSNKLILGEHQTTTLHQKGKYSVPRKEWLERISEGDELFEFLCMTTKNDNSIVNKFANRLVNKHISTTIDIIPFAMVYLPTFVNLFEYGIFCGLDKDTLEPLMRPDIDENEEWLVLKDDPEKLSILYNCLLSYFQT